MNTVAGILKRKGGQVYTVAPDDTVFKALEAMAQHGIGALIVTDGDKLVGIMSERDYARKVIIQGKSSRDTPVREIMTSEVISASPARTVDECMAMMTEGRIRHLPVMEGDKLVGLISIGDLVKELIEDQKFTIRQLENYIAT